MELILIRHGETKEGKKGILLGQLPGTLTAKGRRFADEVGRVIAGFSYRSPLIIASDLERSKETARAIARITHAPLKCDRLLRERNGGIDEGKKESQINWKEYERRPLAYRRHEGGESFADVKKRASAFLEKIQKEKHSPIIIVSHQALISTLLSELFGWSYPKALKFDLKNKLVIVNTKKREWTKSHSRLRIVLVDMRVSLLGYYRVQLMSNNITNHGTSIDRK